MSRVVNGVGGSESLVEGQGLRSSSCREPVVEEVLGVDEAEDVGVRVCSVSDRDKSSTPARMGSISGSCGVDLEHLGFIAESRPHPNRAT